MFDTQGFTVLFIEFLTYSQDLKIRSLIQKMYLYLYILFDKIFTWF
jgi:hypothetical protein